MAPNLMTAPARTRPSLAAAIPVHLAYTSHQANAFAPLSVQGEGPGVRFLFPAESATARAPQGEGRGPPLRRGVRRTPTRLNRE